MKLTDFEKKLISKLRKARNYGPDPDPGPSDSSVGQEINDRLERFVQELEAFDEMFNPTVEDPNMSPERFDRIMWEETEELTPGDVEADWHFCCEMDGLLLNAKAPNNESCHCLKGDEETSNGDVDFVLERFDQTEPKLQREIVAELIKKLGKAEAFKQYVHQRLSDAGVPDNPEPQKTEQTGCRIGPRLDWLLLNCRFEKPDLEGLAEFISKQTGEPCDTSDIIHVRRAKRQ